MTAAQRLQADSYLASNGDFNLLLIESDAESRVGAFSS